VYFLLIVAIATMFYMGFRNETSSEEVLTINEVAHDIQAGDVSRIVVDSDDKLQVIYSDGTEVPSQKEPGATLVEQLTGLGVTARQLRALQFGIRCKRA
jgi:hypothetical protein